MFENIRTFLEAQKKELMRLDEAEGYRKREESGKDFSIVSGGQRKGLREILYENTIKWITGEGQKVLFNEFQVLSQPGVLNEATLSTNIATFTTSLLPAVRRIYSRLLAMELVSVQPLSGPSGYIYYIDHKYGTTKGSIQVGDRVDSKQDPSYSNSTEAGAISEINVELTSKLVSTESKKLKAIWTLESQQDLSSQWNLDVWGELQPVLVDQIAREIDRLIINALYAGAGAGNVNWYTNGYLTDDKSTWERRAYRKTLYEAICEAAALVYKKRFVTPNWLLMGVDTFTRIQKLEKFAADPTIKSDQTAGIGWRYEGTLANKYSVYVDPWITTEKILVGFRGPDWKYAVGYYAPYIPLFLSEEYIVNDDFSQRARGAMSRYAYGVLPEAASGSTTTNGLATVTITAS